MNDYCTVKFELCLSARKKDFSLTREEKIELIAKNVKQEVIPYKHKKLSVLVNTPLQFNIFKISLAYMVLKFLNPVPNWVKSEGNGVKLKKEFKFYLTE